MTDSTSNNKILLSDMFKQFIIKLTPQTYHNWRAQVSQILVSHGYMHFLDGSSSPPSPTIIDSQDGSIKRNPAFLDWYITDARLMALIKLTLSGEVMAMVDGCISARHVWMTLELAQFKQPSNTLSSYHNNVGKKKFDYPLLPPPLPVHGGGGGGINNIGNTINSQEKIDQMEEELSKIVGLEEIKFQLRKWAKGMLMDERRRAMGIDLGPKKLPHMAFLGNPGTGKTTVARILGKLLYSVGVLSKEKLVEVQRSDLVANHIGETALKTRAKIKEAMGGMLFVDEAYRLIVEDLEKDFGREALEEIMSVLEDGNIVVIFAGYTEPMKRVFSTNEGFTRRVSHFFEFNDFSCNDLAKMLMIKISKQNDKSRLYGFKLHPCCTLEAVCALIEQNSTDKLRNKLNGGLVDHMLNNARENLDFRLNFDSEMEELVTITLQDLEAGLKVLTDRLKLA